MFSFKALLRDYGLLSLAVLALVVVSGLAVFGFTSLKMQGEKLYEDGFVAVGSLAEFQAMLLGEQTILSGIPAELDLVRMQASKQDLQQMNEQVQALLPQFEDMQTAENIPVVEVYQQYFDAGMAIFGFAEVFAQRQAVEQLTDKVQPLYEALESTIHNYQEIAAKDAEASMRHMQQVKQQLQLLVLGIVAVLIMLVVAIGGYLGYLQMRQKLQTQALMGDVQNVLAEVSTTATHMDGQANDMQTVAKSAGSNVQTTSHAVNQTTANMESVSAAVEELASTTEHISQQAGESRDVAHQAIQEIQNANQAVASMSGSVEQINGFVNTITDIAEQTNLLALNAAIEAARAGEMGRGFAVVADEVRKLANQTNSAAADIVKQVQSISSIAEQITQTIGLSSETIGRMNEISEQVRQAVSEQNQATQDIAQSVTEVTESMGQVSADIGVLQSSSAQVEEQAGDLKSGVADLTGKTADLQSKVQQFVRSFFG